jgi:hypothetical protein
MSLLASNSMGSFCFFSPAGHPDSGSRGCGRTSRRGAGFHPGYRGTHQGSDADNLLVGPSITADGTILSAPSIGCLHKGSAPLPRNKITQHLDLPSIPPVDMIVRKCWGEADQQLSVVGQRIRRTGIIRQTLADWDAADIRQVCEEYAKRVRKFGGVVRTLC